MKLGITIVLELGLLCSEICPSTLVTRD